MDIAVVISQTAPIMFAMSESSVELAVLNEGDRVEVLERINELWWKIGYNEHVGYTRAIYLKGENFNEKMVNLMISIPRDCAESLFNALKFALKR